MLGVHGGVRRLCSFAQAGVILSRRRRHERVLWFCAARSPREGEGKCPSSRDKPHEDHYALLGVSSDASAHDIKLAFRQLARQYHPDVNDDSGAADTFKTIRMAYETLSDKASKHAYDQSLRAQGCAARKSAQKSHQGRFMYGRRTGGSYKQYRGSYWNAIDGDGEVFDWNSAGSNTGERFSDSFHGHKDFTEEFSQSFDARRGPTLHRGWADSMVDVFIVFCLIGFIWHTLGAQLALTYFVFFIPHNTEHTLLYKFASLMAWLIGGTKGLALHYGIVTTGWLYGRSHDMVLALVLTAFWMETHFPHAFAVPRGAMLLMAHICLGGSLSRGFVNMYA